MTLSQDDLKSIAAVVQPMIDELAISTAQGFEEIHKKADAHGESLTDKIDGLERKVDQVLDDHEVRISKLEKQHV